MAVRVSSHVIGDRGQDNIRLKINEQKDALFREVTGRDYGIDGIIELFKEGIPTGKIAYVQIKTSDCVIKPLVREPEYISCKGISSSNLCYCMQRQIPMLLLYISLKEKGKFYYKILNKEEIKINKQKTVSIRIPVINNTQNGMDKLFQEINNFYR